MLELRPLKWKATNVEYGFGGIFRENEAWDYITPFDTRYLIINDENRFKIFYFYESDGFMRFAKLDSSDTLDGAKLRVEIDMTNRIAACLL